MNGATPTTVPLSDVLRLLRRKPLLVLHDWNWKAAALSAVLRGTMFFALNRGAGRAQAMRAMLVELVYGVAAAGVAGAVTQRMRYAVPLRRTLLVVFLVIPLLLSLGQAAVHGAMRTPRLRSGLLLSVVFASLASSLNWWAMRHGLFLTGNDRSSLPNAERQQGHHPPERLSQSDITQTRVDIQLDVQPSRLE